MPFMAIAESAELAEKQSGEASVIVYAAFSAACLETSFGKSDILLRLSGIDNKQVRKRVYVDNKGSVPVVTADGNLCNVPVVMKYKHLGGIVLAARSMRKETRIQES